MPNVKIPVTTPYIHNSQALHQGDHYCTFDVAALHNPPEKEFASAWSIQFFQPYLTLINDMTLLIAVKLPDGVITREVNDLCSRAFDWPEYKAMAQHPDYLNKQTFRTKLQTGAMNLPCVRVFDFLEEKAQQAAVRAGLYVDALIWADLDKFAKLLFEQFPQKSSRVHFDSIKKGETVGQSHWSAVQYLLHHETYKPDNLRLLIGYLEIYFKYQNQKMSFRQKLRQHPLNGLDFQQACLALQGFMPLRVNMPQDAKHTFTLEDMKSDWLNYPDRWWKDYLAPQPV